MKQALIIGGMLGVGQYVYADSASVLFSATSGAIALPGSSGTATWQSYLLLGGFIALLVGLFFL